MTASLWRLSEPLLLASTSRTRRMLLEHAGLPVETQAPGIDERALEAQARAEGVDLERAARRLAAEKALAVSRRNPGRLVVGADQMLECDGRSLHKPDDLEAARRQLAGLAGRTHILRSAVAVARDGALAGELVETARLTMRALGEAEIDLYLRLAGAGALRSVGAYELEGLGIHLFERIEGEHSTILGLPLLPLLAILRRTGALSL